MRGSMMKEVLNFERHARGLTEEMNQIERSLVFDKLCDLERETYVEALRVLTKAKEIADSRTFEAWTHAIEVI